MGKYDSRVEAGKRVAYLNVIICIQSVRALIMLRDANNVWSWVSGDAMLQLMHRPLGLVSERSILRVKHLILLVSLLCHPI